MRQLTPRSIEGGVDVSDSPPPRTEQADESEDRDDTEGLDEEQDEAVESDDNAETNSFVASDFSAQSDDSTDDAQQRGDSATLATQPATDVRLQQQLREQRRSKQPKKHQSTCMGCCCSCVSGCCTCLLAMMFLWSIIGVSLLAWILSLVQTQFGANNDFVRFFEQLQQQQGHRSSRNGQHFRFTFNGHEHFHRQQHQQRQYRFVDEPPETDHVTLADFKALGLTSRANYQDVKNAYHNLALTMHPDKNPDCSDCNARFVKVTTAYSRLKKHLKGK